MIKIIAALLAMNAWAGQPTVFSTPSTLEIKLEGQFQTLFSQLKGLKIPEGRQSANSAEAFVPGQLTYNDGAQDISLPVKIRVRGHITKTDCAFPKLELEFESSKAVKNTIFAGNKTIKLATHCNETPLDGANDLSRAAQNQLEAHREVFINRFLNLTGLPGFQARQASVTYIYTDAQKTITRNAFFLESNDSYQHRLGVEEVFPAGSEAQHAADEKLQKKGENKTVATYSGYREIKDQSQVALSLLVEDLIGNYDWYTYPNQSSVWNIKIYKHEDGTKYILPIDFNLSALASKPLTFKPTIYKINDFSREDQTSALQAVLSKKAEVYGALNEIDFSFLDPDTGERKLDAAGEQGMKSAVDAIFQAVESRLGNQK